MTSTSGSVVGFDSDVAEEVGPVGVDHLVDQLGGGELGELGQAEPVHLLEEASCGPTVRLRSQAGTGSTEDQCLYLLLIGDADAGPEGHGVVNLAHDESRGDLLEGGEAGVTADILNGDDP